MFWWEEILLFHLCSLCSDLCKKKVQQAIVFKAVISSLFFSFFFLLHEWGEDVHAVSCVHSTGIMVCRYVTVTLKCTSNTKDSVQRLPTNSFSKWDWWTFELLRNIKLWEDSRRDFFLFWEDRVILQGKASQPPPQNQPLREFTATRKHWTNDS